VIDASAKSRPWKALVAQVAGDAMAGRELMRGPLAMTLRFVVRRPKGHYGKRGLLPSAPPFPTTKPDLLKLARGVEDALSGVVYGDDAQIVRELLIKEYGEERVEIIVREIAT
jgi:Holliday junction resolvase RusA-like endonuclease